MVIGDIPRGEDFANKYARGEWAEQVLIDAIAADDGLVAFQYGVSRGDALTTKAELDRVKEPDAAELKRPDILVFEESEFRSLGETAQELLKEFISADAGTKAELLDDIEAESIIGRAVMAIEAESSKFNIGKRHSDRSLSAYVKDEDLPRLQSWRDEYETPIFVIQLFFDRGYIIPLEAYETAHEISASVPGFKHGKIPNIPKNGLQAKVETFPKCDPLGKFVEPPRVVEKAGEVETPCEYDWDNRGKLQTEASVAIFKGGRFEVDTRFTDYY